MSLVIQIAVDALIIFAGIVGGLYVFPVIIFGPLLVLEWVIDSLRRF